jgi:DedD protein
MSENQDTEVTLGTGKLLGFFFGMVIICGIFFSLGYLVGKGSSQAGAPVMTDSAVNSNISSTGGAKPAAGHSASTDATAKSCAEGDTTCTPGSTGSESAAITATPAAADNSTKDSASDAARGEESAARSTDKPAASAKNVAPELNSAPQSLTGIMVQVAAVTKQEDADALVKALRKKEYPVFVVAQADNKLFHVQVGPFAQQKDAEAMRAKLAGDGYNAILKK